MGTDNTWDCDEPESASEAEGLDFLGHYVPVEDTAEVLNTVSDVPHVGDTDTRAFPDVSFTVSNPSGVLSATAGLGGCIGCIELTDVSRFDEVRLGEEIIEIAAIARDKARAAQHEVTLELMGRRGQDRAGVRALLEHSIGLPSYEATSARAADQFAERYRSNDD